MSGGGGGGKTSATKTMHMAAQAGAWGLLCLGAWASVAESYILGYSTPLQFLCPCPLQCVEKHSDYVGGELAPGLQQAYELQRRLCEHAGRPYGKGE